MKEVVKYLPEGWESKAWELGAMTRRSDVVQTEQSLLRLNMLYVTNEGSFQLAALGMALTEGVTLSKVAVSKRVGRSGEWLRWMSKTLLEEEGLSQPKPAFLKDREVVLIDGSDEAAKGSKKSDYRLHYAFNLFQFKAKSIEITSVKEGETLTRHTFEAGEIALADRAYGTITGMAHVRASGADFLLRLRASAFHLYDQDGVRMELLPRLRPLGTLESTDFRCFYKDSGGDLRPLRIVALKKSAEAIERAKRNMAKKARKKQRKDAKPDTFELSEYIVLATSLDYTNDQILELYRARWQVEQVFYRLKSLFGYGNTPNKRENTIKAWFYGKLLLAALCESILKKMSFPPESGIESIIGDLLESEFMG